MNFPRLLRVASIRNGLIHNGSELYEMPDFHILEYLAQKLKFHYEVEETSLSGILELLWDGKADIGIARLPIKEFILDYADITVPYHSMNTRFMIEKSGELPKFKAFTYPFSIGVWIFCVSFTLVATSLSKYITSSKTSLVYIFLSLVGSLLKQPLKTEVDSLKKRIWWITWLVWAGLFSSLYSALFLSFLTVPTRAPTVKNFQELSAAVQNQRLKCKSFESYNNQTLESGEEHIRLLAEEIAKNKWYIAYGKYPPLSKTEASIANSDMLEVAKVYPPNRIKSFSEDFLTVHPNAICVRKGFCCIEQINLALLDALSAGLVGEFYGKIIKTVIWEHDLRRLEWIEETTHSLSIEELQFAFYLLLFGYVLCIIVFLCELFIPKHIVLKILQHNSTAINRRRKTRQNKILS